MLLQVFACSAAVSGAEAHLQELLPKLAASARVRSLSYVSIQNQGNYLVELPAARTDVPKGWDKVRGVEVACLQHNGLACHCAAQGEVHTCLSKCCCQTAD